MDIKNISAAICVQLSIILLLVMLSACSMTDADNYIADESAAEPGTAIADTTPLPDTPSGSQTAPADNTDNPATNNTPPDSPDTPAGGSPSQASVNCQISQTAAFNNNTSFAIKKNLIQEKMDVLNRAIAKAESSGIDTTREAITLRTADFFLKFSDWDKKNQPQLLNTVKKWERINANRATTLAAQLPGTQLEQLAEVLDAALVSLDSACSNPASRKTTVLSSGPEMPSFRNGYFEKNGQRFYPWSLNWAPANAAPYFSQFTSAYIDLTKLGNENGGITKGQKNNFRKKLNQQSSSGQMLYLFLGHGRLPNWSKQQYPGLQKGARLFTKYDIDHPKIREWWETVLKGYVPEFSRHPQGTHIYMIANEPHWFTAKKSWNTGIVSQHTISKFKNWLQGKYSDISALNSAWGKNYTSFDAVVFNVPVPNNLKSTASWYDWMRFNMNRSSEWFQFLCNAIKKHDPQAMCTIKVVAGTLSDHKFERDHGIHRERISRLQAVNGVDTKMETRGGIGGSQNLGEYALHWQEMAFNFDFMKSISPQSMIFDSEWHGFSNVHWRHLDMPTNYVQSSLWLAHLYGMGMTEAWYWARNPDGSIKSSNKGGFIGSLLTQPRMLNSYAQTMLEINNHSAEVEALLEQPRKINLLYVEEAAIQTPDYLKEIGKVYEAVSFLGAPVAIKTASALHSASASELNQIDVLLVPAATHASNNTVAAVRRYQNEGGQVIFIGSNVFRKTELSINRNQANLADFSTTATLALTDKKILAKKLETTLADSLPAISCLDSNNQRAWGIICKTAKLEGKDLLAIVNVSSQPQTVTIRRKNAAPGTILDRITTESLDSDLQLEPMQFRLLTVN